jgi:hypothetical protein
MSTLRVSTIQDTAGSNSSTPAAIANGIAKAWVNFNGTGTVAIRAQYNVSSITDNGTGDYTVNFTTALANANYTGVVSAGDTGSNSVGSLTSIGRDTAVGYFRFNTNTISGPAAIDRTVVSVAIFR